MARGDDNGGTTTAAFERLPEDTEERRLMVERLEMLQEDPARWRPSSDQESVVLFRLGPNESYAVSYRHAVEILPPTPVRPVPCTPPHIAGVVNRRGELLTVLDPRRFFRTAPSESSGEQRILAVSDGQLTVGLLVDELLGHERVDWERMAPAIPSHGVSNIQYVRGIHRGEVTVVDVEALLADPALNVEEKVT